MKPSRRTTLASVLLGLAVLVPTTAWYVSGSRDTSRRISASRDAILGDASATTAAIAHRLETRLGSLRISESERPFYHYQSLYHDPRGAAEGLSVARSPLASGIRDPLIKAFFQIDASGAVTLPTLNERFPELSAEVGFALYCNFLDALRQGHLIQPSQTQNGDTRPTSPDEASGQETGPDSLNGERILILERAAWEQNLRANSVYGTLTGRESGGEFTSKRSDDSVVVGIGPLRWNTLMLETGPELAALRQVTTPNGVLVQGFAIDHLELIAETLDLELETEIQFGAPEDEGLITVDIGTTDWSFSTNVSALEREVERRSSQLRSEFRNRFWVTSLAVVLSAIAVIVILAQTERLARQRARFAASAAHELKTPIASLRLYAEMLRDGLGDPQAAPRYTARLADEAARLGRVVANMLDLARLERGALRVDCTPGDLVSAIEAAVDRHRRTLEDAAVEIEVEAEVLGSLVLFDRDAVDHIIDNLLDNAEKHTRGTEDRRVTVQVTSFGKTATVDVTDNGPGVPPSLKKAIFEPFDRGVGVGHTRGLGLGLSISRALARAQGGDLEVIDDDSSGARLRLSLGLDQSR